MGSVWFDLVVYQVSTFYYAWNWSKSLVWWWVGGGWWLKATLVFIFGPNLKTKTLFRPRPKLNNMENPNIPILQHPYISLIEALKYKNHKFPRSRPFVGSLLGYRNLNIIPPRILRIIPLNAIYKIPA